VCFKGLNSRRICNLIIIPRVFGRHCRHLSVFLKLHIIYCGSIFNYLVDKTGDRSASTFSLTYVIELCNQSHLSTVSMYRGLDYSCYGLTYQVAISARAIWYLLSVIGQAVVGYGKVLSPTKKETSYSDRRFWVSYILFITIIGGILVLYIYIYK
jgi:hypothetical protein